MKSLRSQTYGTQTKSACLNLGLEVLLECGGRMQCVCPSWECMPGVGRIHSLLPCAFPITVETCLLLGRIRKWGCPGAHLAGGVSVSTCQRRRHTSSPSAPLTHREVYSPLLASAHLSLGMDPLVSISMCFFGPVQGDGALVGEMEEMP